VESGDIERVTKATGAKAQTTVNNLDPKVLGTCERFEERQVRGGGRAGQARGRAA
jgi:T-complex protein 1 subunit eta